jgi:hypothetical protein
MKGSKIQIVLRWEEDPTGELRDGEKNYVLTLYGTGSGRILFFCQSRRKA